MRPQHQHETPLAMKMVHKKMRKNLKGFADYSIWYDRDEENKLATNLIIVEAKQRWTTDAALPQLMLYIDIVHKARKKEESHYFRRSGSHYFPCSIFLKPHYF